MRAIVFLKTSFLESIIGPLKVWRCLQQICPTQNEAKFSVTRKLFIDSLGFNQRVHESLSSPEQRYTANTPTNFTLTVCDPSHPSTTLSKVICVLGAEVSFSYGNH